MAHTDPYMASVRRKHALSMPLGHILTDKGAARGVRPSVMSSRTLTHLQRTMITYPNIRHLVHVKGVMVLKPTIITPKMIVSIHRGPMEA